MTIAAGASTRALASFRTVAKRLERDERAASSAYLVPLAPRKSLAVNNG
jgi:hypothetical protein